MFNNWCVNCGLTKISQNKINQENTNKTTIPGGRIYFNQSIHGGNKYWILYIYE